MILNLRLQLFSYVNSKCVNRLSKVVNFLSQGKGTTQNFIIPGISIYNETFISGLQSLIELLQNNAGEIESH